tara:strand:- start:41 stop:1354 length:1314 start_codon:yes stop_codon:yes gene_type:complete
MTTFDYTTLDLQNPSGNNGLSSFALYFQRVMYREAIYPADIKIPLDTWYDKQYYGRIDQKQNTIMPKYENLKPITTTGRSNLLALNFVADAFEQFAGHMRNATILGVLKTQNANEKIFDMKAYQAYDDPTRIYSEYTQQLYTSFVESLTEGQSNKITNFETFVKTWFAYLKNVSSFIPVTKTNYLLTGVGNSFNSGLSIAIDSGPPEDDDYKYENWINDPNFDFYIKAAKKFGFIVNKNIPWVLTVDLFSNACIALFDGYYDTETNKILTKDNFFEVYYDQTYLSDIDVIRQLSINAYNSYIQNNPIYQVKVYKPGCDKFSVENEERVVLPNNEQANKILSDKVLVDFYLELRSLEAKEPVQITQKLRTELANIYRIRPNQNLTSLQNATNYINLIYRDYIYEFDYLFLNTNLLNNLDNQVRSGNITTVGSITQQLY